MLVATGVLITGVLVIMVGTTVQTLQKVGWAPVSPVQGLELPYWSGLWLGLYPTWQGILAQAGAAVFVVGSYVVAESLRSRRRQRIVAVPDVSSISGPWERGLLYAAESSNSSSTRGSRRVRSP
jgi:high-affinity iron transporter